MAWKLTGWQPGSTRQVAGRITARRTANSVDACGDDRHRHFDRLVAVDHHADQRLADLRPPSESQLCEARLAANRADAVQNRGVLQNAAGTVHHAELRCVHPDYHVPDHYHHGNHPIARGGIHLRVVAPTGDGHLVDCRRSDH